MPVSKLLLIVLLLVAVGALLYLRKKQGAPGAKASSTKPKGSGIKLSRGAKTPKAGKAGGLSRGRGGRGRRGAPEPAPVAVTTAIAETAGTMTPAAPAEAPAEWAQPQAAAPEWAQPQVGAPEWAQPQGEAAPEWAQQPAPDAPPAWMEQGQAPAMAQMSPAEAQTPEHYGAPSAYAEPHGYAPEPPALAEPEVEFDFGAPAEEPTPAPAMAEEESWASSETFEWGAPEQEAEPAAEAPAQEVDEDLAAWGAEPGVDEEPAWAPAGEPEAEIATQDGVEDWSGTDEPEAESWGGAPADEESAAPVADAWSMDDASESWDNDEEDEMATVAVPAGPVFDEEASGSDLLDGWMSLPPGGSFAAVLARPVIAQGKFVVAGHATGTGAPVIGAVALAKPLDDGYWSSLTPRDRARHVILDVDRTVNCSASAVEVIGDPELAPDTDGFVVRALANRDGAVMVSGRYSIR